MKREFSKRECKHTALYTYKLIIECGEKTWEGKEQC